jgi:hypothetical protein
MEQLKPGDFIIGGECTPGVRHYIRRHDDGRVETGHAATMESAAMAGNAAGCIEFEPLAPGADPTRRRVKRDIRYTARGPAAVSTNAYRNGWDAVYGKKELN